MKIDPYLFYNGRCEEAIEFYKSALGAEVQMVMRNSDSPSPPPEGMLPPGSENKIMHASILVKGALLMLSDGSCDGKTEFNGFSISLDCDTQDQARQFFDALAAGGRINMPLSQTFWAPLFGMVVDKFGVNWMVGVSGN